MFQNINNSKIFCDIINYNYKFVFYGVKNQMKAIIELIAICVVSGLLILFVALYFLRTKKRKKLNAAVKNLYHYESVKDLSENIKEDIDSNQKTEDDISEEWVEQFRIINAQLELLFQLSPAFIVCYDYGRNCFYISENGQLQLGYDPLDENGETDQKKFESLIHEDDIFLYEEITDFEDIRKHTIADSPYIIKIKNAVTELYGEYLMRIKPIYDGSGINKALIAAFIHTDYIKNPD